MFSRILTAFERAQAKAYLARDGERTANIQVLVSRAESFLPTIESDLELVRRLVATYNKHVRKKRKRG